MNIPDEQVRVIRRMLFLSSGVFVTSGDEEAGDNLLQYAAWVADECEGPPPVAHESVTDAGGGEIDELFFDLLSHGTTWAEIRESKLRGLDGADQFAEDDDDPTS